MLLELCSTLILVCPLVWNEPREGLCHRKMRGHDSQIQAIQSTISNFMFDSLKGSCTLTNLVS